MFTRAYTRSGKEGASSGAVDGRVCENELLISRSKGEIAVLAAET